MKTGLVITLLSAVLTGCSFRVGQVIKHSDSSGKSTEINVLSYDQHTVTGKSDKPQ